MLEAEDVRDGAAAVEETGSEDVKCLDKCVKELPLCWDTGSFREFLSERNIAFSNARKRKNADFGFVTFNAAEEAEHAKQQLEEAAGPNGKKLKLSNASPRWKHKRNGKESEAPKDICDVVTPLASQPYEEQLRIKRESVATVIRKFVRHTRKCCQPGTPLPDWLVGTKEREGLACDFEGIIASPVVDGYRNKCEFSIGCSADGKRVVGFQMGMFREGITAIASPANCRNVSKAGKFYASVLEGYVSKSELPVWDKEGNTGFWRMLTVREGRNARTSQDEVLIIVQVCPVGMQQEAKTEEYNRVAMAFSEAAAKASPLMPLTCFTIQEHHGVSNAAPADAPLLPVALSGRGDKEASQFIHDSLSDLLFRISPTSFFQVNTPAAEKLYALAGEWAGLGPDTLLFDVCCGTGTIGLTLARKVGMVVGIELNAEAVKDARTNAELNKIENCRFVCAKAEDVISRLLSEYDTLPNGDEGTKPSSFSNVVVIVDPPRSGLHPSVVKTLRLHARLKRLVYISCNPETLVANAIELCAPCSEAGEVQKGRRNPKGMTSMGYARQRMKSMPESEPFKPMKAKAVDLFPHTHHCEMVMLFER